MLEQSIWQNVGFVVSQVAEPNRTTKSEFWIGDETMCLNAIRLRARAPFH